ncbi:peptidase S8/S53 domain-containing protein, partial [Dimargaris cristalligena]
MDIVHAIVPNQIFTQEGTVDLRARQASTNLALTQINHVHTGVSTLASTYGTTGAGVKIGIIDSGIDYTHPAFGNCFKTTNCKVGYGYDLVGDVFTGSNTPQPKANPLDQCNGHGTHVAGIIAGNNGNFKGVAPGATLGVYRVMGCASKTNSAMLIQALQMAYLDGMKIINLSISAPSGFNADIDAFCSDFLFSRGVMIVAAAGNEGVRSFWMTGSPATGTNVITVGSMEPPTVYGYGLTFTNPTGVYQVLNNPYANRVSTFSSRGPGLAMEMKPTLVAPGSNVYSTYPVNFGSYTIMSGTSMASPYVA